MAPLHQVFTGECAAIFGKLEETGQFTMKDYVHAGLPDSEHHACSTNSVAGIMFDMGFGGQDAPSPLKLEFVSNFLSGLVGEENEQNESVKHVTFCGLLDPSTEPKRDVLGKVMTGPMSRAMNQADEFLAGITQHTDTCILAGRGDIGTVNIPCRPVHPLLYKKV